VRASRRYAARRPGSVALLGQVMLVKPSTGRRRRGCLHPTASDQQAYEAASTIELTLAEVAVVASMCPVSRASAEWGQTPAYRNQLRKVPERPLPPPREAMRSRLAHTNDRVAQAGHVLSPGAVAEHNAFVAPTPLRRRAEHTRCAPNLQGYSHTPRVSSCPLMPCGKPGSETSRSHSHDHDSARRRRFRCAADRVRRKAPGHCWVVPEN
jgi:hypothetical protein